MLPSNILSFSPLWTLCLPSDLKLSTFIRRYPNIFIESSFLDSGGSPVLCFSLAPEALELHHEEMNILQQNQLELQVMLCKLLMLTSDRILPLQTIDQLKWDLGLPYDYQLYKLERNSQAC
ncbi:hypothetical protein JHK82_013215 [Glycine max]|uniref:PORR domain-containing protein n=1 Tax=Glycine max TaxID=3847 RepID=C6TJF7_SOYBN|nr:unknown [Glycine max]KAG5029624.1 hypothetical protein JHK87_013138 [Glycine soja]KAG4109050.1 hypothetical protein GLYMA_U031808v4 [Glycine max]KAG5058249.1 hypothetical protein JHK86_013245 [Glycine max]KAG5155246.1 hypothetical protein JHK82_013215 [Glycine max]